MNILYSTADLDIPGFDGGSAHAFSVVNAFLEDGHKVILISKKGKEKFNHPNLVNLQIKAYKNSLLKNINFFFGSFFTASYLLLTRKIDIVYERGRIFGGGAVLAGWLFHKPIIYEMNEPLGSNKTFTKKCIKRWNKFITQKATLITGMHESFFRDIPKEKYLIITNAANPITFSPEIKCEHIIKKYKLTHGKTILYSGSFAPWHACENMIEIAKKLIQKDKKIKILMIGYGKKFDICNNLIKKYNLQDNVFLTGKIPYSEIPAHVNAADICLALFNRDYHEYKESGYFYSPVKLFEYMSSGKPVVASNVGNIRRLVTNGRNGFLVDEENTDEVVSAIYKLMSDKKLYKNISKNNRELVLKKYNWKTVNKTILNELAKHSRASVSD